MRRAYFNTYLLVPVGRLTHHGLKPPYCSLVGFIKEQIKALSTNNLGHQAGPNRTSIKANHWE